MATRRGRRRKMGAISTGTGIALAAGGLVLVYLATRPKTPAPVVITTGSGSNQAGNSTSSIITASGGAFSDIWGSIFGNP